MKKFFKEFRDFISRGNVLDMAVGIIVGGAFTAIITSLVNNILTPLINWIPGTDNTGALQVVLRPAVLDPETGAVITQALVIDFGAVISAMVTFLITAFVLFCIVKAVNSVHEKSEKLKEKAKKEEEVKAEPQTEKVEAVAAPAAVPATEALLAEIRDLLKEKSSSDEKTEV